MKSYNERQHLIRFKSRFSEKAVHHNPSAISSTSQQAHFTQYIKLDIKPLCLKWTARVSFSLFIIWDNTDHNDKIYIYIFKRQILMGDTRCSSLMESPLISNLVMAHINRWVIIYWQKLGKVMIKKKHQIATETNVGTVFCSVVGSTGILIRWIPVHT